MCSIHCTDATDELILLKSAKTWETIENAATIRNHELPSVEKDLASGLPVMKYHRLCYQVFTMKSKLDRILTQRSKEESVLKRKLLNISDYENEEDAKKDLNRTKRNISAGNVLLPNECIFCKRNRYKNRRLEPLIKCVEDRAVQSIRFAAESENDFVMLGLLSNDIIASEAKYHSSCYKIYTKPNSNVGKTTSTVSNYKEIEIKAFREVVAYCHELTTSNIVVPFSLLQKKMENVFIDNKLLMTVSTKKNLRRNLEKIDNNIEYININNCSYIYQKSLTTHSVMEKFIETKNKLENLKKQNEASSVNERETIQCGMRIRNDILKLENNIPWPPHPQDLEPNKIVIPESLKLLLRTVFDGKDKLETTKSARTVLSIAQDVIYCTSRGKIRTPKSILLPMLVKTLTNNTELITILNRLGHSISYTLLMESLTEHTYEIVETQLTNQCVIPKQVNKEDFTIFVADNIDRNEETLSGFGTTHKVNNLLIQHSGRIEASNICTSPEKKRGRRRSFKPAIVSSGNSQYLSGKRIGPKEMQFPENDEKLFMFGDRERDNFLWALLRYQSLPRQVVPSWTGFNIEIQEGVPILKSSIYYLDCIDAPATEISTIYQVMERALIIIQSLKLTSIVCVFDQAIYSKAMEIKWRESYKFKDCVIMMGIFHLLMVYMAILYKRFSDAGLRDALIQSGIVAEGSVDSALKGKQYNRGIRLYKIFYEGLVRILLTNLTVDMSFIEELKDKEMNADNLNLQSLYNKLISDERFKGVHYEFLDLKLRWKEENGSLQQFWLSYIEMVELLLNIIYAVRAGCWHLLVECIREMLPYIFAYDHINYSRYLSVMLGDMLALPSEYPEIYEVFLEGKFAAQLSEGKMFSKVETDKVIEMTLNKDTKSSGGTTGFSTNVNAVQRWELSASYRSALRRCMQQHVMYMPQNYQHKDLRISRIQQDEKHIQAVIAILTDTFINPFTHQTLVSISTGIQATEKIIQDMLQARNLGQQAMDAFLADRLCSSEGSVFDPIKKLKLATFATMNKNKVCKLKGKEISLKSSKDLFCKVTIIAQKRSINLNHLFEYPLGPLPLSLAETDGTLKKSAKSALLHKIEGSVEPAAVFPDEYAFIADGMACVRQIKTNNLTYSDFANNLLKFIIGCSKAARRVDVIFDVYVENSIKDVERTRRSHGELTLKKIVSSAQIKQWNLVLSSGENKNKLIHFIVEEWKKCQVLIGEKVLYVTSGNKCYKIAENSCSTVDELQCDHQEADTRLLLHSKHASITYNNLVLYTQDTDVFTIALCESTSISAHLFMLTGTKNARRIIDIGKVGDYITTVLNKTDHGKKYILDALLGYHCFSGCDSVSSFAGKGKVKPLNLLLNKKSYVKAFASLGTSNVVSDEVKEELHKFVCHMYGRQPRDSPVNVNYTRYLIYCQKNGKIPCDALPPCANVLDQHIYRSNYQCHIWRKATVQFMNMDDPSDHGWCISDGQLDVKWMTCKPAPDEILELISCSCKSCDTNCPCLENHFVCTDACLCKECLNYNENLSDGEYSEEETDGYSEDDYDSDSELC